jgi:hypothetical protein
MVSSAVAFISAHAQSGAPPSHENIEMKSTRAPNKHVKNKYSNGSVNQPVVGSASFSCKATGASLPQLRPFDMRRGQQPARTRMAQEVAMSRALLAVKRSVPPQLFRV